MSWWDASGFTNLASQALKNAQKKIDKVLDIEEEQRAKRKLSKESSLSDSKPTKQNEDKGQEHGQDKDFWSGWLGGGPADNQPEEVSTAPSSWSLPWGSGMSETSSGTSPAPKKKSGSESSVSKLLSSASVLGSDVVQAFTTAGPKPNSATTEKNEPSISTLTDSTPVVNSDQPLKTIQESALDEKENAPVSDTLISDWQDFPLDTDVSQVKTTNDSSLGDMLQSKLSAQTEGSETVKNKENESSEIGTSGLKGENCEEVDICEGIKDKPDSDTSEIIQNTTQDTETENRKSVAVDKEQVDPARQDFELKSFPQPPVNKKDSLFEESPMPSSCPEQSSLKDSTSSSFTAVSIDSSAELLSSSLSVVTHKEDDAQKSSAFVDHETDKTQALQESAQHIPNVTTKEYVEEATSLTPLELDVSNEQDTAGLYEPASKDSFKNPIVEGVTAENLVIPDEQKSQTDFIQDYVNITSVTYGSQTVSTSSDELHTSSELELGNSRTSSDLDLPGGRASSTGSSDTSKFDSSIDTVVDRSALDSQSDVDLIDKEHPYSLFGDSKLEGKAETAKVENAELGDDAHSLSSSYVKCMIEEAMEDLSKTEDSGSDNHSNGEKSESSKVDSELEKSVYSGHESSDEMETTTSSDIEIIQAPTPNGDNKYHAPFDLSPLKIALQRTVRDQGHNRSDSQSSSSAHSKAGEMDRLSPERGEGGGWRDDDFHHHDLHAVREEGADSPYHPERLLKLAQSVVQRELQGGQKLAEMAEVLQARESKLIQLSKDNHQLIEDNNILRSQLQQSEEAREAETSDLNTLTTEFTARLGESEKKLQAVLKEKETLKQKLQSAEKELERRSANSDVEALLEEKREQVEELLKEGEKLSKQQLQNSNIIKKLRAKEKENEATLTSQKKKLEEQGKEFERLTVVLDSKEEMEKKQTDAINQLNAAVQRQEKEFVKVKSDLEDALEKNRGLQAALDNSYKEIAELHRSNASQDSKAQEAALSAETQVREELKAAMEREQMKFKKEREAFIMQADDFRLDMTRLEKEHSRREDLLRQEIAHLQERLQQDEARSQDLTQSVTSATRPLLRQIENLQATYGAQSTAWERVEKNLTDRLAEAQTALAVAQEKERNANELYMELSAKVTSLEASNTRLKQEKSKLAAETESDKSKLEELQDARNSTVAQLETSKKRLSEELSQLKMDKIQLESQLTIEHTRLENEKKKSLALEEQLRLAERPRSRGTPSPSPSMSVSRQESLAGSMHESMTGMMNWSFHNEEDSSSTIGGSKTSVYESLRQSGAAIVVENLSSQLKSREGEISQLHSEIGQLERTRESMARELVNLTNQNEELLEMKKSHEDLQEQFKELNKNYSALLQMYGEKEEQVQELRLDLQDIKEMYKTQIDALLAK